MLDASSLVSPVTILLFLNNFQTKMPVAYVQIFGCSEKKVLHRFPAKDENACKIWTYRCYRKGIFNIRPARICYKHFEDSCYERDLRNELLGLPCRLMLRPGSLPTRNLLNVSSITTPNRERTARAHTRSIRSFTIESLGGSPFRKKRGNNSSPPPPSPPLKKIQRR